MKQGQLFDAPQALIEKATVTCRSCRHRYKHQYGNMHYCSKQKQKGTAYGDRKIKAGNRACHMYEPVEV